MKKAVSLFLITWVFVGFSQQVLSPNWNIKQNTNFPWAGSIVRYLSVPSSNVVWATGYDNFAPNRTYNNFTTSKNGGLTYTCGTVFSDTLDYGLSSIFALDSMNAWVSAYRKPSSAKPSDVLYHTTNGGLTWTNGGNPSMFSSSTSFANFICFITPSVGVALGDPVSNDFQIYRTTDGGSNWTTIPASSIPDALTNEYGIANIYAIYGNNIWFGTDNGRVFRSSDGGQSWAVSTVTPASVYGVINLSFVDNNNGLALIYTSGIYSLFRTSDGGVSWVNTGALSPFFGIDDISNIPGTNIFVSCGGTGVMNYLISYSTDYGNTWQDWGGSLIRYFEVAFANNSIGYAGGQANVSNSSLDGMYKYSGGPVSVKNSEVNVSSFSVFPNPTNGVVTLKLPVAKNGFTFEIINSLGKVVFIDEISLLPSSGNYTFDFSHLPKGIYFLNLRKENQSLFSKIIIE